MAWWLIPLLIILGFIKSPWFKGFFGELVIRISAKFLLDGNEYRAIHNVTLPTIDGTTQIDHIFVSRYGIFVVETKNYSGWIFGDENQSTWTQKLFKVSNKFQNPLRQNYKHLKALESILKIPFGTFHSVVVFVGDCTFKTPMPPNVTYASGYVSYIKSKTQLLLSSSEVEAVYSAIKSGCLTSSITTTRKHIRHLQSRSDHNASRLCPKCGNLMVLRTIKSGARAGSTFWGCSQYPKCRITQAVG